MADIAFQKNAVCLIFKQNENSKIRHLPFSCLGHGLQ